MVKFKWCYKAYFGNWLWDNWIWVKVICKNDQKKCFRNLTSNDTHFQIQSLCNIGLGNTYQLNSTGIKSFLRRSFTIFYHRSLYCSTSGLIAKCKIVYEPKRTTSIFFGRFHLIFTFHALTSWFRRAWKFWKILWNFGTKYIERFLFNINILYRLYNIIRIQIKHIC